MLLPPVALVAACAAAALAKVAANPPPALGAGADAGVVAGTLLDPAPVFAGPVWIGRGLVGFAAAAGRAVPLYPAVAAGVGFVVFVASGFGGGAVRDIAGFDCVLMTLGRAPESPSSAFLFSVAAPVDATGLLAFATIVGFGFDAGVAVAGDFGAGAFVDCPSLPTDASNAANWTSGVSMLSTDGAKQREVTYRHDEISGMECAASGPV